jgi:hypothetical protein
MSLCTIHLYVCISITMGAPSEVKEDAEPGQQRERGYHPLLNKSYAVMDQPVSLSRHHEADLQSSLCSFLPPTLITLTSSLMMLGSSLVKRDSKTRSQHNAHPLKPLLDSSLAYQG